MRYLKYVRLDENDEVGKIPALRQAGNDSDLSDEVRKRARERARAIIRKAREERKAAKAAENNNNAQPENVKEGTKTRYLKYVRVDEVVTRAKKMERAKIIRNKGQALSSFPKSKPKNVVARGENMEDAGNARLASIEQGEEAARETTPGGRRASISVGRGAGESRRKALAALNTSFVPLTLPNIMEINIVKGPDGKPRLASGNGTTLRTRKGLTKLALAHRAAGTLSSAGAKSLKGALISIGNARAQKPSKFGGKRHRTSVKERPQASSGGLGKDYKGVDMARDSMENKFK